MLNYFIEVRETEPRRTKTVVTKLYFGQMQHIKGKPHKNYYCQYFIIGLLETHEIKIIN